MRVQHISQWLVVMINNTMNLVISPYQWHVRWLSTACVSMGRRTLLQPMVDIENQVFDSAHRSQSENGASMIHRLDVFLLRVIQIQDPWDLDHEPSTRPSLGPKRSHIMRHWPICKSHQQHRRQYQSIPCTLRVDHILHTHLY